MKGDRGDKGTEMKQRSIGTGGRLEANRASNAYEKPKKPVTKKKVTAADMKSTWLNPKTEKPEDVPTIDQGDAPKFSAPVFTVNEDLNKFLVEMDSEGDDRIDQAREYLLRGPPFKGTHDKNYKVAIKDTGCKWMKNPDFVEGEWGSGQRFGWYVAHDTKELKAVLTLPRKIDGERAWSPCDLEDVSMRYVDELIDRHTEHKCEKEEKLRKAEEERRKEKERALGRGIGASQADLPHDIQAIKDYMTAGGFPDWEYDRDIIASSAPAAHLGPMTPTHALRVRRGLRHNIITPAQVARAQWESDETIRKREREEAHAEAKKRKAEAASLEVREEEKLKRLKARAYRATRVLQRDDDIQTDEVDDATAADIPHIIVSNYVLKDSTLKSTVCHMCATEIHEQFMDCTCTWIWKQCKQCLYAFCDNQECRCAFWDAEVGTAALEEQALPPVDDQSLVAEDASGNLQHERESDESDRLRVCAERVEGTLSAKAQGKQRVTWEEK